MPRTRRRLAVKLALCTLAGAVVTWAVAWGCALVAPDGRTSVPAMVELADGSITSGSFESRFGERWSIIADEWPRPPTNKLVAPSWVVQMQGCDLTHSTGYGFPAVCLIEHTGRADPQLGGNQWFVTGWAVPGLEAIFPTTVLPMGYSLNTALYSLLLLGAVELVSSARQRRKTRRGLCPACGYDRRGLDPAAACPECGGVNA